MTSNDMTDEPRDPFADEGAGLLDYALRKGEMVFVAIAELDNITQVLKALKDMPESDLNCIVLERPYAWHAAKGGPPYLRPGDWLTPPDEPHP